jgi:hypothetical protein
MTVFGVDLKHPSLNELTAAIVIAAGLGFFLVFVGMASTTKVCTGANLAAIAFGGISSPCDLRARKGIRPLALNIVGCGLVRVADHLLINLFV